MRFSYILGTGQVVMLIGVLALFGWYIVVVMAMCPLRLRGGCTLRCSASPSLSSTAARSTSRRRGPLRWCRLRSDPTFGSWPVRQLRHHLGSISHAFPQFHPITHTHTVQPALRIGIWCCCSGPQFDGSLTLSPSLSLTRTLSLSLFRLSLSLLAHITYSL